MRTRVIAGAAALVAVLCASTNAAAQSTPTAEVRATEPTRPNRVLLTTGIATIALSYIPAIIVAASSDRDADKNLYIPVAGPWLDLGERGDCPGCSNEGLNKALLITAGVAHVAGVAQLVAAFFATEERETYRVRTGVRVTPTSFGRGGYGMGLHLTF
jgi:hypothetical protein